MTLTKRIIPCLDVAKGRVVKGLNFKSIKDAGDPVLLAEKYSNEGADELVFLDITASEENREIIRSLVSQVAKVINIPFTVGGGVKTLQHARDILLSGADKVAINTGAIKNPEVITELMDLFGKQCIVVAIDVKRNYNITDRKNIFSDNDKKFWFEVFIYGGKKETGIDAIEWAKRMESLGAGEILLTSIDMDGTKAEIVKEMGTNPRRISAIRIHINFPNNYSDKEKQLLERTAQTYPVGKSLHEALEEDVRFIYPE